jgi:two-component system, OmpR family, response regulator QseB
MRILLVEDDAMIGRAVWQGLVDAGFEVEWVMDGDAGEASLSGGVYDLAILDLGLPNVDGMQLLRDLRQRRNDVPVLVASARGSVPERIAGLRAGADDYVLKPFDLDELVARAHALVRRRAGGLLTLGKLCLDPVRRIASVDGNSLALSGKQFAILLALMESADKVLTRHDLEQTQYAGRAHALFAQEARSCSHQNGSRCRLSDHPALNALDTRSSAGQFNGCRGTGWPGASHSFVLLHVAGNQPQHR